MGNGCPRFILEMEAKQSAPGHHHRWVATVLTGEFTAIYRRELMPYCLHISISLMPIGSLFVESSALFVHSKSRSFYVLDGVLDHKSLRRGDLLKVVHNGTELTLEVIAD